MCSYICYKVFNEEAVLFPANKIRKTLGIKIPRQKGQAKKAVIDWVKKRYGDTFEYELTYKGNPVPGTDDRADAILVALAGDKLMEDDSE